MIYLAILVILITEAAKVREHLWAGVDHTQAKSSNGREWPNKFEQFMFYITNRWGQ
jgi:hypothetical protein